MLRTDNNCNKMVWHTSGIMIHNEESLVWLNCSRFQYSPKVNDRLGALILQLHLAFRDFRGLFRHFVFRSTFQRSKGIFPLFSDTFSEWTLHFFSLSLFSGGWVGEVNYTSSGRLCTSSFLSRVRYPGDFDSSCLHSQDVFRQRKICSTSRINAFGGFFDLARTSRAYDFYFFLHASPAQRKSTRPKRGTMHDQKFDSEFDGRWMGS